MKIQQWVVFMGVFAMATCSRADIATSKPANLRLYGLAEQFTWKESYKGRQLLKESGPLFGLGGDLGVRLTPPLWLEGRGELFLGTVDYDGGIMNAEEEIIPYSSMTSYAGLRLDGDLAVKIPLNPDFYVKPYAGLGVRAWSRTLDTALTDRYIGDFGYVEDWVTLYSIIGCGAGLADEKGREAFGRFEARIPLENSMTADLTNQGGPSSVKMVPGKQVSFYAEGGINAAPFTTSIFLETLAFSESPLDSQYQNAFQPKSTAILYGIKFGLTY